MEARKILHSPQTYIVLLSVVILSVLLQSGTGHPAQEPISVKRDVSSDSILTLISVEREPTPGGNRYTVRFTKNTDDLGFRVQDEINTPREPNVTQEAGDIWAASFVVPIVPDTSQWFLMGDDANLHLVALRLNNSDTTPGTQDIPELPVFQFNPPNEAVYSPNEDVTLRVIVPRNSETGQVVDNMQKNFYGVDFQTMDMHFDLDDDNAFTISRPWVLDYGLQVAVRAHTSRRPMSGYLQMSTQVFDTGGPLLTQIQVARSLLVRPVDQAGPYPSGYLTFLDKGETSVNGHELHRCGVGYECLIYCASVGSSISDIEVKQIEVDGSLIDVPSSEEVPEILNTARNIYWKFRAEEDSGDINGITSFQCRVRDLTHGTVATKTVDVRAEIPPVIDAARSNITVEDDPMYPFSKILTFHCAVKGRPIPDVTFYAGSARQFHVYSDPPDSVISTGQNEAVASRVVFVDATDLAQAVERIHRGQATGPSCGIFSPYQGRLTYEFYPTD